MEPCTTYQNTHHQSTVVIGSQRGNTCCPFRFKLMSNIKQKLVLQVEQATYVRRVIDASFRLYGGILG